MNFKEVTGVVTRALARRSKLSIPDSDELRGITDALAIRYRYGSVESNRVSEALEALLQVRCEVLARREFAGVAVNLDAILMSLSLKNAFLVVARLHALEIVGDITLPPAAKEMVDQWSDVFEPLDAQLRECAGVLQDEAAFELRARAWLDALKQDVGIPTGTDHPDIIDEESEDKEGNWRNVPHDDSSRIAQIGRGSDEVRPEVAGISSLSDPEGVRNSSSDGYCVFTRQFDEIADAESLFDVGEREILWQKMQEELAGYDSPINSLAARLQRVLLTRKYQTEHFDQEDGVLDGARLARLITTPARPLVFRRDGGSDQLDTLVTLLIDTSSSMRGRSIIIAAASAAVLARTLEHCGIKVEILGYTTRNWNGGQSRRLWLEHGRRHHPGRLNDLRHIIYKRADVSWARARPNLAVMLKPGLLKENIDGEALLWAYKRLAARPERRRILIVIADGAPIDNATLSENPRYILSEHLLFVTKKIERLKRAELIGIGVRRDVSEFYRRSLHVPDVAALGKVLVYELTRLLA